MDTLKYALRFLTRAKAYTLISLSGVAFSLACSIVLLRYIHRELTVDAHCIHPETVVVPLREANGAVMPSATMYLDSVYFSDEQIAERCLVVPNEDAFVLYKNRSYQADILAVDSAFFRFFAYPLVAGTIDLKEDNAAVLTRRFAEQLFGNENPLGKVMNYDGKLIVVKGVIDEPSCKTTWHFDLMVSSKLQEWSRMNIEMLRVLSGVDLDAVNRVSSIYRKSEYYGLTREWFVPWKQFYFAPSVFLKEALMNHGNKAYLLILSGVVILLLTVGILNFINLYMVMMMKRSCEYGIRKVLGMSHRTLFASIWLENLLLTAASLFVAWLFIELTAVPVTRLLGESVGYTSFDGWLSLGILLLLPLLTSVYPYVKYAYRSPVTSMRNVSVRYSVAARAALLGVQYVFTVLLVVLSVYFICHFRFLTHTPPGFRTEGILEADLQLENRNYADQTPETEKALRERKGRISKALDECPYIDSWIYSSYSDFQISYKMKIINDEGVTIPMPVFYVPSRFFDFYGLEVVDGKLPDEYYDFSMVLNEAAMKAFGYTKCEEAFIRGEAPLWISVRDGKVTKGGIEPMPVEAVIKDCFFGKLTDGIQPVVFSVGAETDDERISMLVKPGKEKELMNYLRKAVKEVYGTEEFDSVWLSDLIKEQYAYDRKITTVYSVFAFVAIVVSCMGLFGISLFDIRRRYREIAIRKVNGASAPDLYRLLGSKYLKVLLASFVAAVPLAWLIINHYTSGFVLKAPLSPWIFIVALLLVATVSFGTLWWQVSKAVRINPVEVIKEN